MEEGKLLRHIVSEDGVNIDPKRVSTIQNIHFPWNKKEVQSFIGKIYFLRRFIPNLAETMKLITHMMRKDNEIKWTPEACASFNIIKQAIRQFLVLISPNYDKDFLIFSFASKTTISAVLLQKSNEDKEQPIAFFSR